MEQLDIQRTGLDLVAGDEGDLVDTRLDLGEAQAVVGVPGGGKHRGLAVVLADEPHGVAVVQGRVRIGGNHLLHEEELLGHLDGDLVQAVHRVELEVLGEPVRIQDEVGEAGLVALDGDRVALVQVHDGGVILLVDHHGLDAVHRQGHERGSLPGLGVEGYGVVARNAVGERDGRAGVQFDTRRAVAERELAARGVVRRRLDERIDIGVEIAGHGIGELIGLLHPVLAARDGLQDQVFEVRTGHAHVLLLGGDAELDVLRREHGRGHAVGNVLVERDEQAARVGTVRLRTDRGVRHDRLVELELDLQGGQGNRVLEVDGEGEIGAHQGGRVAGDALRRALVGGQELRLLLLAGHQGDGRQSHIEKLFHIALNLSKWLKQRPLQAP